MRISQFIIRFCPGKIGLKLRKLFLRYKGAKMGKHCRLFFGFFLFTKDKKVDVEIGFDVHFGENSTIKMSSLGSLIIGDHVKIGRDVEFEVSSGHLKIGTNSRIGRQTQIITSNYVYGPSIIIGSQGMNSGKVDIGENVWIGAGCIILSNVCIDDNCVIGAGSIVTKSILAGSIYAGNPAKAIK